MLYTLYMNSTSVVGACSSGKAMIGLGQQNYCNVESGLSSDG